ncbi:MAG TPA: c-type cytochrome, partial [Noviherbaspirillum sp.]
MISLQRVLIAITLCLVSAFASAADASQDKATQIWQLLDYMAVDYGGAVANGKVTSEAEYAEMQEFAQVAATLLGELPDKPQRAALLEQARNLKLAVANKAADREVADIARNLAAALLSAYPVPVAPAKVPDLKRSAVIYQAQCASCHGAEGRGDGPLGANMEPAPIAFTDRERARERSLFSLHQSITRGVEGTAMKPYSELSDEDRWALAFYISTFAFSKEEREAGKKLWASDKALHAAVPNLDELTQLSESSLEKTLPAKTAGAVLAHLRSEPDALNAALDGSLALAKNRLRESLDALGRGDRPTATRLALSAYLDGFEPVEPALAIKDKALLKQIEQAMGNYRAAISGGDIAAATAAEAQLQSQLAKAQNALEETNDDKLGVFLGALTILLREGLEALLVVVAMIAFLKKAERREVLPYV